jgi:hypothetical protein
VTVQIRGTTARDAWFTVSPDGRARVHVEVRTGAEADAIARAVWYAGQGPAAAITASATAHRLRKGRRIIVYGAGLAIASNREHLVVCGCSALQHDPAPPARAAAAQTESAA